MGKIIGKTGQTFGNRKRDPESLTLAEVRLICHYLKIDRADFALGEIIFNGRHTAGDVDKTDGNGQENLNRYSRKNCRTESERFNLCKRK